MGRTTVAAQCDARSAARARVEIGDGSLRFTRRSMALAREEDFAYSSWILGLDAFDESPLHPDIAS